jgi:hypothetical protein
MMHTNDHESDRNRERVHGCARSVHERPLLCVSVRAVHAPYRRAPHAHTHGGTQGALDFERETAADAVRRRVRVALVRALARKAARRAR